MANRSDLTRRDFLLACMATPCIASAVSQSNDSLTTPIAGSVQTVQGPILACDLGRTLPHEHVMCDFAGADKTDSSRWNPDEVFETMLPYLRELRSRGITGFIDCTPAFIGRDVKILYRLSQAADIHIITNTGYYGAASDKYVPAYAYNDSCDSLAERWTIEFNSGIEGTNIRPGFIKIGVDGIEELTDDQDHGLSKIDAKIVRAAARTHKQTGLPIASHTGQGLAALAQIAIIERENVDPSCFIFVHADSEQDQSFDEKIANKGAWIEYDGISGRPPSYYIKRIKNLLNHTDQILLSMDSGWFNVGQTKGGNIRNYNYLTDVFIPSIKKEGFSQPLIDKLTISNPANAFKLKNQ